MHRDDAANGELLIERVGFAEGEARLRIGQIAHIGNMVG